MNNSVLIISDLHAPFDHKDAIDFLREIKRKYKPDRVISVGDLVDNQALSFYVSDSDLPSAGDELNIAINKLRDLYKLFPNVDVLDSNHGSMAIRKAKFHGIPMKYIRSIEDVLEAPKGWNWFKDVTIKLPSKQLAYFHHGMKKNGIKLAQQMGMNVLQGHYHTEFSIKYSSSPAQLIWSMQVGCLIDDTSLSFAYNKTNMGRPILGCGVIIDSHPQLVPMILNKSGRWIRRLV